MPLQTRHGSSAAHEDPPPQNPTSSMPGAWVSRKNSPDIPFATPSRATSTTSTTSNSQPSRTNGIWADPTSPKTPIMSPAVSHRTSWRTPTPPGPPYDDNPYGEGSSRNPVRQQATSPHVPPGDGYYGSYTWDENGPGSNWQEVTEDTPTRTSPITSRNFAKHWSR